MIITQFDDVACEPRPQHCNCCLPVLQPTNTTRVLLTIGMHPPCFDRIATALRFPHVVVCTPLTLHVHIITAPFARGIITQSRAHTAGAMRIAQALMRAHAAHGLLHLLSLHMLPPSCVCAHIPCVGAVVG